MSIGKYIRTSMLLFFAAVAFIAAVYYVVFIHQDMSSIRMIAEQQLGHSEFILGGYKIGVSSAEDLGFYVHRSAIELHYGEQVINIKKRSLQDTGFVDALAEIGIVVYQKDDAYRITYWDEEIKQWIE